MPLIIGEITTSVEYKAISNYYGESTAERSGVRLMNHIDQGLVILNHIMADHFAMRAFCLHPIFQIDEAFIKEGSSFTHDNGFSLSVLYALEYRGIANAYLTHHVMSPKGIHLSPFKAVNDMLIADKVQNRKDFENYHRSTHCKRERLDEYFREWLAKLGVSETQYQEFTKLIS
jgi:hypothetical protein